MALFAKEKTLQALHRELREAADRVVSYVQTLEDRKQVLVKQVNETQNEIEEARSLLTTGVADLSED